ncbi:MAG: chloride channel protein [Epsilonproteobacteria bacterium]|nr:chloride channel protein [Campylobacterota bacterium]
MRYSIASISKGFPKKSLYTNLRLNLMAVSVGIVGGFGAVLFRWLIYVISDFSFFHKFSINFTAPMHNSLGLVVVIIPAIGGLLVGFITYYIASETKGHGVPEVMEAMYNKEGIIRPRVVLAKTIASGICLGTGGSAGREGPIVQIGSAFGSAVSQLLKLTVNDRKTLVGCGATAGIAATFNAPLAGILFSIELILLEFKTESFVPLVLSSVFATIISRTFLGAAPIFLIPLYHFRSPYELIFYLIMGILSGFLGIIVIKSLYGIEDLFDKMKIHPLIKPAIGGLILGIIGLKFPQIFGVGYSAVSSILSLHYGNPTSSLMMMLLLLLIAKIIALSVTLGSGSSGGVFAPSLFIGAVFGSLYGILINILFPGISAPYPAYGLVGMAALFAATGRATLTSIIILFEMTRNYDIIIPLIFACVLADITSDIFYDRTIYTEKLARRGVFIPHGLEINILKNKKVESVMIKDVVTANIYESIQDVSNKIMKTGHEGFPVINDKNELVGIISGRDILQCREKNSNMALSAFDACSKNLILTHPDETLDQALEKMRENGISHLPVVDEDNPKKLLGIITKGDLLMYKAQ